MEETCRSAMVENRRSVVEKDPETENERTEKLRSEGEESELYITVGSGGSGFEREDPPKSGWDGRDPPSTARYLGRAADGSGPVGLAGWVGSSVLLDRPSQCFSTGFFCSKIFFRGFMVFIFLPSNEQVLFSKSCVSIEITIVDLGCITTYPCCSLA